MRIYNRDEAARLYQKALGRVTYLISTGQSEKASEAARAADELRDLIERHGG